jgi:hypothetical protein
VQPRDLLIETYDRLPGLVTAAVEGLTAEQLQWSPAPGSNPVGWLVWHLTRIQDQHLAELLDTGQVWARPGLADRFGLPADPTDTGYGHSAGQVEAVRPEGPRALVDYHEVVRERLAPFLAGLGPADLDRVVDEAWDPPVTLGVRLVSMAQDALQHLGQAHYVRGLLPPADRLG